MISCDALGAISPSNGATERLGGKGQGELVSWNELAAVPMLDMVNEVEAVWLAITRQPNLTTEGETVSRGNGGSLKEKIKH